MKKKNRGGVTFSLCTFGEEIRNPAMMMGEDEDEEDEGTVGVEEGEGDDASSSCSSLNAHMHLLALSAANGGGSGGGGEGGSSTNSNNSASTLTSCLLTTVTGGSTAAGISPVKRTTAPKAANQKRGRAKLWTKRKKSKDKKPWLFAREQVCQLTDPPPAEGEEEVNVWS